MNALPYLTELCRLFIFVVLLLSSVGKARTFGKFRDNLSNSFKVPEAWTKAATILIIGVEGFLAVVILLNNEFTYMAMWGALLLFVGFTLLISVSVIQDRLIRCNCFGQNEEYISSLDIVRNMVLLLACGFFLYSYQTISMAMPIQLLLFGMAFIAYLVVTNLKNIETVSHDPKRL